MAVKSIQLGQVWRKDDDGKDYLVTKVYSEVFSQYAVLRPAEVTAPDAPTVRVKVAKGAQGASLPDSRSPRKDRSSCQVYSWYRRCVQRLTSTRDVASYVSTNSSLFLS